METFRIDTISSEVSSIHSTFLTTLLIFHTLRLKVSAKSSGGGGECGVMLPSGLIGCGLDQRGSSVGKVYGSMDLRASAAK